MSLDDFERCTPTEFNSICESHRMQELRELAIMRWEVAMHLQPFSKKAIKPQDLLPIPEIDGTHRAEVSKQEADQRFNELMKMREHDGQ